MHQTLEELQMVHEEEMVNYDRIQTAVLQVMHRHGCRIIQTPTFEDYDTYGRYFPGLQKEMVKTIDADGSVLVLRPDVTLPLVKMVAREYPDTRQLLKFGYVSTVFREYYGRSTHGKYFLQSGVEILGDDSPECDGEVIVTAAEFLEALGISKMRIDLGTVAYMDALFADLNLPAESLARVRQELEERNLVALRETADQLAVTRLQRDVLVELPRLFGDYGPTMGRAEALSLNTGMAKALERTKAVYEYLKNAGYGDRVQLDLGFTSHMGYYTDSVFKIYADGALYSMISGGRYDRLSAQFHAERPACGFGMNMNLLYEYMADEEMLEAAQPSADLAVLYDQASPELIRDINGWRKKGFAVIGVNTANTVLSDDFRITVRWKNGSYEMDGQPASADAVEARLRRL